MSQVIRQRQKKLARDIGFIVLSIIIAFILHASNQLENSLKTLSGFYFGLAVFFTGIFFASTFTVAIATSIFLFFSQTQNPLIIALIGGLGAFVGDSFIFKFLKDDLIADFEFLSEHIPHQTARRILHSKLIFWLAPIVAALLIASPIPDEIGLVMLAGIKLKYKHFFILSFILNTIGILVIVTLGKII